MKFKVLALFVALQIGFFSAWSLMQPAHTHVSEHTHSAAETPFGHVHFSTKNTGSSTAEVHPEDLENVIIEALQQFPAEHVNAVENVILDYDEKAHRGLGGGGMVILRSNMATSELVGVLIHELAHNVDLVALNARKTGKLSAFKDGKTPIYIGDPSLDFYRISWVNENTLKKTADNFDFVSGYAMTNPFEDFAESYAYYVLQNANFKTLAQNNPTLFAKWRFMKYRVFDGVEFDTGTNTSVAFHRPWDTTVLPYDVDNFLSK